MIQNKTLYKLSAIGIKAGSDFNSVADENSSFIYKAVRALALLSPKESAEKFVKYSVALV